MNQPAADHHSSIVTSLRRHWFLVGLLVLIPLGIILAQSKLPGWVYVLVDSVPTPGCTAAILFLMSITLNSGRLLDSLRRPLPVIAACAINQLAVPLLCLPLLLLQQSEDMRVGLLIAASVPCTMAAASVWTRRAEGNDAVSLLVTLLTNGFCFVVTPAWLSLGTRWFGTSDTSEGLGFQDMMTRLVLSALLPALAGQLLRLPAASRLWVDRQKPLLSNVAQSIILTLVFISVFKGGLRFHSEGMADNIRHTEFAIVWLCCIGLHLVAMVLAWSVTGMLNFSEEDRRACVFAGSQKTLPIGIVVSEATGLPFSLLPMLMFHASQLFIDTWVADRLKQRTSAAARDIQPADRRE